MYLVYSPDLRITDDGRIWVMAPAGTAGPDAQWRAVTIQGVRLDASHPDELLSEYGGHSLGPLGGFARASHTLGLPRCDPIGASRIRLGSQSLFGKTLAIDLDAQELVAMPDGDMVYPFSSIATVGPQCLRLKAAWPNLPMALDVAGFPIDPPVLARIMGIRFSIP